MERVVFSRTTLIWLLLVAATLVSFELGHGIGLHDPRDAGIAILVVSFVKARMVIREFMEIRHAPLLMRLVADFWVLGVCGLLILLLIAEPVAAAG